MDLGVWQQHSIDPVRARRLATGYATGALLITGLLGVVAMTAAKAYGLAEETVVEAALVDTAKDEPEVVIKEEEHHEQPAAKPKALAPLLEPVKLDTKLVEKEPTVHTDNPYGSEDPYALLNAAREAPEAEERPKVQEAPKIIEKAKLIVPKAANNDPIRVTEDVTPPKALSMTAPSYPADAKAAGIEGTVVVSYVVTEQGEVKDVVAVRGPAELTAVCVAAVQSWRFSPALKDGQPVAVHRMARFPFKIKT